MITLHEMLKLKREDLNLSLRDAANLIGISHSYLNTLEKGVNPRNGTPVKPTPEMLKRISIAYDESYYFFMSLAGYNEIDGLGDDDFLLGNYEKDVEKMLDKLTYILMEDNALMLSGELLSREALESILDALSYGVSQAKKINKKFKPKKATIELNL